MYCSCPSVLGHSVFLNLCSLCFQFSRILLIYLSSSSEILSSAVFSLLTHPSDAVFIFMQCILSPVFPSQDFHLSAFMAHLFSHALYSVHYSLWHIVVLNSSSDNANIPAILSLQIVCFPCDMSCNFFYGQPDIRSGWKSCKEALSNVVRRCGRRGSVLYS